MAQSCLTRQLALRAGGSGVEAKTAADKFVTDKSARFKFGRDLSWYDWVTIEEWTVDEPSTYVESWDFVRISSGTAPLDAADQIPRHWFARKAQ